MSVSPDQIVEVGYLVESSHTLWQRFLLQQGVFGQWKGDCYCALLALCRMDELYYGETSSTGENLLKLLNGELSEQTDELRGLFALHFPAVLQLCRRVMSGVDDQTIYLASWRLFIDTYVMFKPVDKQLADRKINISQLTRQALWASGLGAATVGLLLVVSGSIGRSTPRQTVISITPFSRSTLPVVRPSPLVLLPRSTVPRMPAYQAQCSTVLEKTLKGLPSDITNQTARVQRRLCRADSRFGVLTNINCQELVRIGFTQLRCVPTSGSCLSTSVMAPHRVYWSYSASARELLVRVEQCL